MNDRIRAVIVEGFPRLGSALCVVVACQGPGPFDSGPHGGASGGDAAGGIDVPFWDADAGLCTYEPEPSADRDACDALSIGRVPHRGDDVPCASHDQCGDDEFCGAGACRLKAEASVTVCIEEIAIVGRPRRLSSPASPPDVSVWWRAGDSNFNPTTLVDTCRVQPFDFCALRPLVDVAHSEIMLNDSDSSRPPSDWLISTHRFGDVDDVLAAMDTCYEVPRAYGMGSVGVPGEMDARLWVYVTYP